MQSQQIDLTTIKDINELKVMAYEAIKVLTNAQQNVQMIEARIAQLQEAPKDEPKPETKK
jgi:hypothetical protein